MKPIPLELRPLIAPFWARGGHAQTLIGHLIPSPKLDNIGEIHQVKLEDGDTLVITINRGVRPIVFSQFHGLSGNADTDYMRRGAILAQKMGLTTVLVNHRDAGIGRGLAVHPYHSGRAEDVSAVLSYLKTLFPGHKQIAAGYSMSANMILFLCAGQRGNCLPDAAIAINAPINLRKTSHNIGRGLNKIYDRRFVYLLRKLIIEKKQGYHIPRNASLWDLDHLYTAPAGGFADREDYYQTCSAMPHVQHIRTPTYVLTSADDPFVDADDYRQARWSPSTHLTIGQHGGHLGYYSRDKNEFGTHRWLDHYLHQALEKLCL